MAHADVYRGDDRKADELQKAGGFKTWCPFTEEQARDLIRVYTGVKAFKGCGFDGDVKKGSIALELPYAQCLTQKQDEKTPLDLAELIKRSRNKGPWISTDSTEECGGYASGYIYKINCAHLNKVEWEKVAPDTKAAKKDQWPNLWMDGKTLEEASSIAIENKGATKEVTFFTTIPMAKIKLHKSPAVAPKTKETVGGAKGSVAKLAAAFGGTAAAGGGATPAKPSASPKGGAGTPAKPGANQKEEPGTQKK